MVILINPEETMNMCEIMRFFMQKKYSHFFRLVNIKRKPKSQEPIQHSAIENPSINIVQPASLDSHLDFLGFCLLCNSQNWPWIRKCFDLNFSFKIRLL